MTREGSKKSFKFKQSKGLDRKAQAKEIANFIKNHYSIYDLWDTFHLEGNPRKKTVDSPWAAHGSMSFSVFDNGRLFKDWSTGEKGDVITFFGKIHQIDSNKEALIKFAEFLKLNDRQRRIEIEKRPVVEARQEELRPLAKFYELDCYLPQSTDPLILKMRSLKGPSPSYHYTTIRTGSDYEIRQVAALRTIPYHGLLEAHNRGLLRFGLFKNRPAFFVLDNSYYSVQARRMDGKPYQIPRERKNQQVYDEAKGLTLMNSHPSWPLGLADAQHRREIYFVEGGPDFLAAIASRCSVDRPDEGFVCMLGVEQTIHPDALPLFKGKNIHLLMQNDTPGIRACNKWRDQLTAAGAIIKTIYFPPAEGKDINDVISSYTPDPFAQPKAHAAKKTEKKSPPPAISLPTIELTPSSKEVRQLATNLHPPPSGLVKVR
jgi:hypothetical protein